MGLHCLLLTNDATLLRVMRSSCSVTSVELEMRTDSASAIELSARRHLDSFAIDYDVPGAAEMLAQIRTSRANKQAVIFAVVDSLTGVSKAIESADFVLGKPVQDSLLRRFLDLALPRMKGEYRRYFRHKVDLPIELLCRAGQTFARKI